MRQNMEKAMKKQSRNSVLVGRSGQNWALGNQDFPGT
jgi:hypothetical protein